MGTLNVISEAIRQDAMQDENFYKSLIYFFELRIPPEMAPFPEGDTFLFPLALNPESYTLDEPFALEKSLTQGGGLYVEENGIVERMIRLRGTTGFKPRRLKGGGTIALLAKSPEKKSYGRKLMAFAFDKLSGQRHFHYLQDVVFRTYGDYKGDPATAAGTKLIFHNPKDEEHWLVAPEKFSLERVAGRRTLYQYSIDLLVLDTADAVDHDFSEDKSLLDSIKDAVRTIKDAVDLVAGAVDDINAIVDEISNAIKDIGKILDGVGGILDSASAFVEGTVDLIESPYAIIESVGGMVDSALELVETVEDANEDVRKLPDRVKEKFQQIRDALDLAGTHPESFERPVDAQLREILRRQELATSASAEELAAAEKSSPPANLDEVRNLGTSMTPGDVKSARSELKIGRATKKYTGAQEVALGKGDNLANLAARYLGDARLWPEIAVLNGLKPPFIDEQAGADLGGEESPFSGVLGIGKKILIPNYSKPPQALPLLPVLGVRPERPMEDHLLGTDFAMEPVGKSGLYDFVVDTDGGSVDAKMVSGVDNIKQALTMRLGTEKGTDTMYRKLGLRRTVGLKIAPVDLETGRFNVTECIGQDPRVASVRRVSFEQEDDAVATDMDVELRGFTRPTNVKVAA